MHQDSIRFLNYKSKNTFMQNNFSMQIFIESIFKMVRSVFKKIQRPPLRMTLEYCPMTLYFFYFCSWQSYKYNSWHSQFKQPVEESPKLEQDIVVDIQETCVFFQQFDNFSKKSSSSKEKLFILQLLFLTVCLVFEFQMIFTLYEKNAV